MRQSFYPATPPVDQQAVLRPSRADRRKTRAAAAAIFLFGIFYLVLLAIALSLAIGGIYGGITIISMKANAYTNLAGAGLIASGTCCLTLFVRFAFASHRSRHPHRTEVSEEEQPRLYEFIKQLTQDTQTSFPRRIYLIPGVSVAVFYPSSFRSIFLPVPKNLEIGLGLINALSVGEFKAVLAHELGHFSSRATKLEKYVYTTHRALYHLVYEPDRWDQSLSKRVLAGGITGFFASILQWMIGQIRSLLQGAYEWVHRYYLNVSREMEHRADWVATSVSGHEAMISALRRVELSAHAYDQCTHYLGQWAELKKKTEDIYANHRTIITQLANQYQLVVEHGLPLIPDGMLAKNLVHARVVSKDQWTSHPARLERERRILSLPVEVAAYPQSAWKLIKNPSALRRAMTSRLYETGFSGQQFRKLSSDDFRSYVEQEEEKYRISSEYRGFYDGRFLQRFDPEEVLITEKNVADELTFDMVYHEEHRKKIATFYANQEDFETLRKIYSGTIATRYFEFDYKKYQAKDAAHLVRVLNSELARQEWWLTELDQQAFLWHYRRAKDAGVASDYLAQYRTLTSLQGAYQNFTEHQQQIEYWRNEWRVRTHWTEEEMRELTKELASIEANFKSHLRSCEASARIEAHLTETQQQSLIPYLRSEQAYYLKVSEFDDEAFARFADLVLKVWTATRLAYKQSLKSLTDYQLGLQVAEEVQSIAR